jgi:CheY-like chemotaxis protein
MSDRQIVFATEDTREKIELEDVFDVGQDVPASAAPDTQTTVSLGFKRGQSRETASVTARAEQLSKFQVVLFKLVLGDVPVTLNHTGDVTDMWNEGERATLRVNSRGVQFGSPSGTLSLYKKHIEGFKTLKSRDEPRTQQPTVIINSRIDGRATRTTVSLPSFRYMNLLGRFLQSSPVAGTKETDDRQLSMMNVLLVDNDPSDLEMTELMLKQRTERITITTATSADGGLGALSDDSIDCVVSDYSMPGTDGIEFLERVRTRFPDLPFIIFTGKGSQRVAKQALLSDVTDYVEKGYDTQQYDILLTRIKKALR